MLLFLCFGGKMSSERRPCPVCMNFLNENNPLWSTNSCLLRKKSYYHFDELVEREEEKAAAEKAAEEKAEAEMKAAEEKAAAEKAEKEKVQCEKCRQFLPPKDFASSYPKCKNCTKPKKCLSEGCTLLDFSWRDGQGWSCDHCLC